MWDLSPRTIEGKNIHLEPLSSDHFDALCECLLGETNGWFALMYGLNSPTALKTALTNRLQSNAEGKSVSFVTRDKATLKVAGLSHFMNIDQKNRHLEIGGTQVGRAFRRTHANTETKLLMLTDAFERLQTVRVFFKVDAENNISQTAVLRVGAKLEGELRNNEILPDGRIRNYRIYSIVENEWPTVKSRLQERLLINQTSRTTYGLST